MLWRRFSYTFVFSLFSVFIVFLSPQTVLAHSGHTFWAWASTVPVIDGIKTPGEWDQADCHTETITADDGSLQDLTVCVMLDSTNIYMNVQITNADYSDVSEPCYDFINIYFDNNNNGVIDIGEDHWAVRFDGFFEDAFNPNGVAHHSQNDTSGGGTNDITAAITHSNPLPNAYGTYTVELTRALISADTSHDFSFPSSGTLGFAINMADGDPSPGLPCTGNVGGFYWPSTVPSSSVGWADIVISGDSDGDAIPDLWETSGIDIDGDGSPELDLPALGADPNHKDLFVEVDAMTGRNPNAAVVAVPGWATATGTILDRVVNAYDSAPNSLVNNPDATDGIRLHMELDETNLTLTSFGGVDSNGDGFVNSSDTWYDFDAVKMGNPVYQCGTGVTDGHFGSIAQRSSPNCADILSAKSQVYRYIIFGDTHSGGTSSGKSELPGNDLMVTLGGWSTPGGTSDQQAGTVMHEFGHNLDLRHGGNVNTNCKPNYHSIMNYTWQVPISTYAASWTLDYSREIFPTLDESNLDESAGLGGTAAHATHNVVIGPVPATVVPEQGPVDFNSDTDTSDTGVVRDLNYTGVCSSLASPGDVLTGHEDWSNLRYPLSGHPNFDDGIHTVAAEEEEKELTFEQFQVVNDEDNDKVPDASDMCPNTTQHPTVVYGNCDSGVTNIVEANGCAISDYIERYASTAVSHGQFVRSVSELLNRLKSDGLLLGRDKGKIMRCVAGFGGHDKGHHHDHHHGDRDELHHHEADEHRHGRANRHSRANRHGHHNNG